MSQQFGFGNQIIDVTEKCTFTWEYEPYRCYAFLQVSNASGDFTEGETVSSTSASATVFSSYVDGGRVYVTDVSGTFQTGETITGSSSNQTATVDGFIEERNWPNNITHGSFPNSIISEDLNDYLEWESTRIGSGITSCIKIITPNKGIYSISPVFGVGARVDNIVCNRQIQQLYLPTETSEGGAAQAAFITSSYFDGYIATNNLNGVLGNLYSAKFYTYQANKGTFLWRIYNIKIFQLVV